MPYFLANAGSADAGPQSTSIVRARIAQKSKALGGQTKRFRTSCERTDSILPPTNVERTSSRQLGFRSDSIFGGSVFNTQHGMPACGLTPSARQTSSRLPSRAHRRFCQISPSKESGKSFRPLNRSGIYRECGSQSKSFLRSIEKFFCRFSVASVLVPGCAELLLDSRNSREI